MRKLTFILSVVGIAALTASLIIPVCADDKADITALYSKVSAALKARDVKTVAAASTPDFVSIDHGHKLNAKQSLKQMEMEFQAMKSIKELSNTPAKIEVKGSNATVLSNFKMLATMSGQDGKVHEVAGSGLSKALLIKTPKGWRVKSMETLSSKMTMDGKPMNMDGRPMAASAPPSQPKTKH